MKVVIVQDIIIRGRNFRLCRQGEAVFHLRSLIYCAELYAQQRLFFSWGQTVELILASLMLCLTALVA